MDNISFNSLILILCYSYAMCYILGKTGEGYMGFFCISYNYMGI